MKFKWLLRLVLAFSLVVMSGCLTKKEVSTASVPQLYTSGGMIYMKGSKQICHLDLQNGKETVLYNYNSVNIEPNPIYYSKTQIMFAQKVDGTDHDLVIYDVGTGEKDSSWPGNTASNNDRHPSLDGAGANVVYQSKSPVSVCWFKSGAKSGTVIQRGAKPVISPEGTKVAFIDGENHLWVGDLSQELVDGVNPHKVNLIGEFDNPAWKPETTGSSTILAVEKKIKNEQGIELHFIYTLNPFESELKLTQITYSWGKKDLYRHPAWSGDGTILFFCGTMLNSSSYLLSAVYYEEALQKAAQAQWYRVSDGSGNIEEPCWAPDLQLLSPSPTP